MSNYHSELMSEFIVWKISEFWPTAAEYSLSSWELWWQLWSYPNNSISSVLTCSLFHKNSQKCTGQRRILHFILSCLTSVLHQATSFILQKTDLKILIPLPSWHIKWPKECISCYLRLLFIFGNKFHRFYLCVPLWGGGRKQKIWCL